jgi:hypothetical protein
MGKGDRRRQQKERPMGIPDLDVKTPAKPHRSGGRYAKPAEDLSRTVLEDRCRRFGLAAGDWARKALAGPEAGSPIGMVMLRELPSHEAVARLWSVWQGFCAAERTYRARYIGQTGDPKGASLAMVPDAMQADTGHTIDIRTAAQRDSDAVAAWMRWRGYLGHLSAEQRTAICDAERNTGRPIWQDRAPTKHGLFTLEALLALADVTERKARK